ncbi:hypothetical protein [Salinimicrobium sp. WS361]
MNNKLKTTTISRLPSKTFQKTVFDFTPHPKGSRKTGSENSEQ